ncbi:hypothetical protein Scep_020544 [Stephania cephalantha]|uniref:Uncharacterized protein n=1 Tax=Stephania cephalantha TaxID=152367 RepID=A0AAP0IDB5_9MAGN
MQHRNRDVYVTQVVVTENERRSVMERQRNEGRVVGGAAVDMVITCNSLFLLIT